MDSSSTFLDVRSATASIYLADSRESLSETLDKVKSLNTNLVYMLFLRMNALSPNPEIFSFIALIKSSEIATQASTLRTMP